MEMALARRLFPRALIPRFTNVQVVILQVEPSPLPLPVRTLQRVLILRPKLVGDIIIVLAEHYLEQVVIVIMLAR